MRKRILLGPAMAGLGVLTLLILLFASAVSVSAQPASTTGTLGVALMSLNDAFRQRHNTNATQGVGVVRVAPDGAAARAGIRQGDVITRVGGQTVNSVDDVRNQLANKAPGTNLVLTVQTGNAAPRDVTVTLGAAPQRQPAQPGQPRRPDGPRFGPFGFGQGGASHTITVVQGTVDSVTANALTITKANSQERVTYQITADTRLRVGGNNTAADIRPGARVVVTTWDGSNVARLVISPDAARQGPPLRQGQPGQRPGGAA